jgi:hypothetical protein
MTHPRCNNKKCQVIQSPNIKTEEKVKKKGGKWRHIWVCSSCGMGQGLSLRKGSKTWKRLRHTRHA